jgi:hypothetical protein
MPWSTPFDEAIPLPGGGQIVTLHEAGKYIQSLPKAEQITPAWQNAVEALLIVMTYNGPTMFARIAMMQALHPKGEPVFTDRKDHHWGKRRLKRDQ